MSEESNEELIPEVPVEEKPEKTRKKRKERMPSARSLANLIPYKPGENRWTREDFVWLDPEIAPPGIPQHLFDMQQVYARPHDKRSEDRGENQRMLRKVKRNTPLKFWQMLTKAEAEFAAIKQTEKNEERPEEKKLDIGEEKALAILNKLLGKGN